MNTIELLNETAKHLSGYDVIVTIQEPATAGRLGECWLEAMDAACKSNPTRHIAISPRAVELADQYLDVFLHEVAHAKLHMTDIRVEGKTKKYRDWIEYINSDPNAAWKAEGQAERLARRWKHYAESHSESFRYMPDVGGRNAAANYFRLQLFTLLNSQEVTEF